jgi:hypothetical protein
MRLSTCDECSQCRQSPVRRPRSIKDMHGAVVASTLAPLSVRVSLYQQALAADRARHADSGGAMLE